MKRSIGVALARRKDRSRSTPLWATHPAATSLLLDARHQRLGQLCEICCNVQRPPENDRRTAKLEFLNKPREDRDVQEILELLFQDSQRNVYSAKEESRWFVLRSAPDIAAKRRPSAFKPDSPHPRGDAASAFASRRPARPRCPARKASLAPARPL
jgi:hypothetical protein